MAIIINPISPVAFSIFGLDIRWYALAYVAAFLIGFWIFRRLMSDKKNGVNLSEKHFDDLFTAVVLGVIIGGRLGYVLFYNLSFFLNHPLEILAVWKGGMSFHGGLLGVLISVILFAVKLEKQKSDKKITFKTWFNGSFKIMDVIAVVAPIGLFFGRIANFINMEVMGRMTNKSWGVVFAGHESVPRHPSPLYEAGMEGILLFIIMFSLWRFTKLRENIGALSGSFAMLYAVLRIICEQFRAPDVQIGFLTTWGLTMGQLLSALMFFAGAAIFAVAIKKK
ncbi:MAG: prolipoprotein diacylglyceryl transferase [Alphaproteobacteria bacterium]|nr:prolipoprotein diacylglyceryl transferase [Alphaproteobacteria bacterium]MBN2675443.1 prolipoprotein diacylglyceryl transferase [Alphaproteobacteria bacterium]